ncbi:MAG: hypothetical protein WC734_04720 [Patescibacteria group bacterium]
MCGSVNAAVGLMAVPGGNHHEVDMKTRHAPEGSGGETKPVVRKTVHGRPLSFWRGLVERLEPVTELQVFEVGAAKAKLQDADGRYGVCVDSDSAEPHDIEAGRLEISPAAQRCIKCQMVFEQHAAPGNGRATRVRRQG